MGKGPLARFAYLTAALALALFVAGSANGERTQRGDLIVSVAGNISPLNLPGTDRCQWRSDLGGGSRPTTTRPCPG